MTASYKFVEMGYDEPYCDDHPKWTPGKQYYENAHRMVRQHNRMFHAPVSGSDDEYELIGIDPEPWAWHNWSGNEVGPRTRWQGHDSVYGMNDYSPRKVLGSA